VEKGDNTRNKVRVKAEKEDLAHVACPGIRVESGCEKTPVDAVDPYNGATRFLCVDVVADGPDGVEVVVSPRIGLELLHIGFDWCFIHI